jgi:hypothetical protein
MGVMEVINITTFLYFSKKGEKFLKKVLDKKRSLWYNRNHNAGVGWYSRHCGKEYDVEKVR